MIQWNKVTWYSRLGSYIVFCGVVPILAFVIGSKYGITVLTIRQAESLQASEVPYQPLSSSTKAHLGQINKNIVGTWQSVYDTQYIVTFAKGGAITEAYSAQNPTEDASTEKGTWKLFTIFPGGNVQTGADFAEGIYMQKTLSKGDEYKYKVTVSDENNLELMYLYGGSIQTFKRVE